MCSRHSTDNPSEPSAMKRVFEQYAEETISQEQVERVLEPVLKMISEGAFDKPRVTRKVKWLAYAASMMLVTSTAALVQSGMSNHIVNIHEAGPPLTDTAPTENVSGCATITGKGAIGVKLSLVNADNMAEVDTLVTGDDGTYIFRDVPDGNYMLIVSPLSGVSNTRSIEESRWIVADGKATPVYE